MKTKILRFLRITTIVVAVAVVGWTSYKVIHYLRSAQRFEVKSLSVSGMGGPLKRVTESEIVGQAEFEVGTNVFRVDLNAIRERVDRLQWVRHSVVQRVLPDQIIIKVVEREPIGLARIRGEVYQFDMDAMILDLDQASAASFPVLDGLQFGETEKNVKKVALYRNVLEELGQTELSEIHVNEALEISVVSASDPLLVNLGASEFRTRWIRYLQLKTQIQQQFPQAVKIDLRFKNQVVVRMRDDEAGERQVIWDGEKKSL